jgi:hypothetical protein
MQTVFYKALRVNNKHLISANINVTQRYFTNRVNKPKYKNSKLFVFASLSQAINFCEEEMWGHKLVIYSCHVTNPKIVKRIPSASEFKAWTSKRKSEVWESIFIDKAGIIRFNGIDWYDREAPTNTCICDSVELLDKVKTFKCS